MILDKLNEKYVYFGGTVRDWYYKVPPRDIDIYVNPVDITRTIEFLEFDGYKPSRKHTEKDFVDKFYFLMQDNQTDILFSKLSLQEVMNKMNANINQFALINQQIVFMGEKHPDEYGLVILSDSIPESRVKRLHEICENLNIRH